MEYRAPLESYSGKVREVTLGRPGKDLKIGGESILPFHFFEGSLPNPPRLALEVYDLEPQGWAEAVLEPFKEVASDPVKWAQRCVEVFGAEIVCLRLVSTDPAGENTSPDEAAATTTFCWVRRLRKTTRR